MGKTPNDFVPVKYANEGSRGQDNVAVNVIVGGFFALFLVQLYRSMHGKDLKGKGPGSLGSN
jgi:hypothetical protein